MLTKLLFIILITLSLHSKDQLEKIYFIDSNDINISSISQNYKNEIRLFSLDKNRYTKKIKSKELIEILKSHGYNSFTAKSRYVKFIKKSPIDLSKITADIKKFYQKKYTTIHIEEIHVHPRGYIESLPPEYKIYIRYKNYLSNDGTLSIKTLDNKKIFFDYRIKARLDVYTAKNDIKRETSLSLVNCTKQNIYLSRFRAMPIENINDEALQSKQHIKKNNIITQRDVEGLSLVKRGSNVNVSLNGDGMSITFTAEALQDGKLNDIITVQKTNSKKIKVKVTGRNKVEMR
ncbi:flagellar basal body P-ring formation chaperone FlgA [bacterium]|nr:flagellar basal body P-ring formation chaperone FlgA [bacterium]MBU1990007.1 flagellar basal body P-ring formation chaperone FlgA [bacterium]